MPGSGGEPVDGPGPLRWMHPVAWSPWAVVVPVLFLAVAAQHYYGSRVSLTMGAVSLLLVSTFLMFRLPQGDRRIMWWVAAYHFLVLGADLVLQIVPARDSHNYVIQAWRYSDLFRGTEPAVGDLFPDANPLSQVSTDIFLAPIVVMFTIFGASYPLARLLMTLLGLLPSLFLWWGLRRIYPRRVAHAATLVFAFWPSLAQLQTDVLRDNLVIGAFTLAFAAFVGWRYSGRARNPMQVIGGLCAGLFGVALRMANLVLAPVLLFFVVASRRIPGPTRLAVAAGAAFMGLALATIDFTRDFVLRISSLSPEGFRDMRLAWGGGKTAYLTDFSIETWGDVVLVSLLAWVYFILVPFPWQTSGDLSWPAIVENLVFYYPLLVGCAYGLWMGRHTSGRSIRMMALALFLTASFLYGIAEANVGTAMRHRHQFTWLLLYLLPPALPPALDRLSGLAGRFRWRRGDARAQAPAPAGRAGARVSRP